MQEHIIHDFDADGKLSPLRPSRTCDSLACLINDNGNQIALSRLIDYCVLHYRMPEQQARTMFDRAIQEIRFELQEGEMVGVPEEKSVAVE
jgi:hypothetical protein